MEKTKTEKKNENENEKEKKEKSDNEDSTFGKVVDVVDRIADKIIRVWKEKRKDENSEDLKKEREVF